MMALMTGVGILTSYILGSFLYWRIAASIPPLLFFLVLSCGLIPVPESPVWLLGHKGKEAGREALQWLRATEDVEEELSLMISTMEKQSHGLTMTEAIKNLSNPAVRTPFLLIGANFTLMMWSGPFAVIFYAVNIFKNAGVGISEHLAAILVAFVRVSAGFVGMVLMQIMPRRHLAMLSMTLMSLSMFGLGAVLFCKGAYGHIEALTILPIIFVTLFMCAFAAGKRIFFE